jgi:gliding motility-associated-like protein
MKPKYADNLTAGIGMGRFFVRQVLICALFLSTHNAMSQDITIKNPSLEGTPGAGVAAPSWLKCGNSPDIQPITPTYCGITQAASDGKTFAGVLATAYQDEGIAQQLSAPVKKGRTYTFSVDLAFPGSYCTDLCFGAIKMYVGHDACDKAEVMWTSPAVYTTGWKRYYVTFTPSDDYEYFSFWPYFADSCSNKHKASAMLIDNLSASFNEVPQIQIMASNSCKGNNNGVARAIVNGGEAPYKYLWSPGGYTTPAIENLPTGKYEVTVTSTNGTTTTASVQINESTIKATADISNATCYNLANGVITLNASGGQGGYAYSMDNGRTFQSSPIFTALRASTYSLLVKDSIGCSVQISNVGIHQPAPLELESMVNRPISCSETTDGTLIFTADGGTRPYTYKLAGKDWQNDSAFTHLEEGVYTYSIQDNFGCIVDGSAEIVREMRGCAVYVPTAFSPNGDGVNDVFRAKVFDDVTDFRLAVYNRWGQVIFSTTDPYKGWDGTFKGLLQPTDTYMWTLTYTDHLNQGRKQTGTLSMIKQ